MHVYEVRPRKGRRGVDLISTALPFGRLCFTKTVAVVASIGGSVASTDWIALNKYL
jgi:hypothetical protein